jgi:hypothetical protein
MQLFTDVIRLGYGMNGNGNVSRGSIPCHPTMKELIAMWLIRFGFVFAAMAVGWILRGIHEKSKDKWK